MTFYGPGGQAGSEQGNVNVLRATREPCPVCGHETGDCSGGANPPESILLLGTIPSLEDLQTVYVDEDVYGEQLIGDSTRVRFLLAKKGSQISLRLARELGIF